MAEDSDLDGEIDSERVTSRITLELSERFVQMYMQENLDLIQNSLPFVDNRFEKRRRLRLIQALYVAKEELEAEGETSGLFNVDAGVEAIINGDWKEASYIAETFLYAHAPSPVREKYVPMHRVFRELLLRAVNEVLPSDPHVLTVQRGGAWGKPKD